VRVAQQLPVASALEMLAADASAPAPRRLPGARAAGGMAYDSPEDRALAERQRGSVKYIVSRISSQVLSGSVSVKTVTMPAALNDSTTYLQRLTKDYAYADHLLRAAAAPGVNPEKRIGLVAAFLVSSMSEGASMAKCFNAHIGETYSAEYGPPDSPTRIDLEQTRHHPPVSHYTATSPDGLYSLSGYVTVDSAVRFSDQSLVTRRIGLTVLDFLAAPRPARLVISHPPFAVRGLLANNDRRVEVTGPCSVFDEANRLVCDLVIDPPQPFVFSLFQPPKKLSDRIMGIVYRLSRDSPVNFTGAFAADGDAFYGDPDAAVKRAADSDDGTRSVEIRTDGDVVMSVMKAWDAANLSAAEAPGSSVSSASVAADEEIGGKDQTGGSEAEGEDVDDDEGEAEDSCNCPDGMRRTVLSLVTGSWVSHLDVGGERMWDADSPRFEARGVPVEKCLPSDSRHRLDTVAMARAERAGRDDMDRLLEEAQAAKERLEIDMRAEAKVRPVKEIASDSYFPSAFIGV
jgi:Oxysterol-binding protein